MARAAQSVGKALVSAIAIGAAAVGGGSAVAQSVELTLASGNDPGIEYIDSAHNFFVPELVKRAKERLGVDLKVSEFYSGSLVKATEVLDAARAGKVDLGLFCICHAGQKLPLNNFVFLAPFSAVDAVKAQRATREVYGQVPELAETFEREFGQKLISLMPLEPYDLIATFPIAHPADLRGHTVSGSGPNFPWLMELGTKTYETRGQHDHAGTAAYDASLAFAQLATSLKLYDKGMKYFVRTGLGAQVILVLTVNNDSLKRLPDEVQKILVETAQDFERIVAERTRDNYERHVAELSANGMTVTALTAAERKAWAQALKPWSDREIMKLEAAKLPASRAVRLFVGAAESLGHDWPVRFGSP